MANPLGEFYEWLSGAGAIRQAGQQQQAGIGQATNTINDAGRKAMDLLAPYLQGGTQDYGNYRSKVNSGYYNTPSQRSFNPLAPPTNQGYKPTWNPATQSYSSNRTPYQAPQQGPISQEALPAWAYQGGQQGPMQGQGQPQGQQQAPMDIMAILKAALANSQIQPPSQQQMQSGFPVGVQDQLNPASTLPGMNTGTRPMPTAQDIFKMIQRRGPGGIGSGPYGYTGGPR